MNSYDEREQQKMARKACGNECHECRLEIDLRSTGS